MNALLALIALVLLLGSGSFSTSAQAQESPPSSNDVASLKTLHSSGLTATLVTIVVNDKPGNKQIGPQITLTNNSKTRIYLIGTRDGSQTGFLGSGEHLIPMSIAGISVCSSSAVGCSSQWLPALESFSYIEPGDTLALSLTYNVNGELKSTETLSFALALVARFSKPNTEDVSAPKTIWFNFPFVPLVRK